MNPEWLRYYIAAKLNANVEDLDFNPDDFLARVNSDLVGKYVNIASRAAAFISRQFDGEAFRLRIFFVPEPGGCSGRRIPKSPQLTRRANSARWCAR